jgi:hypothetical protein
MYLYSSFDVMLALAVRDRRRHLQPHAITQGPGDELSPTALPKRGHTPMTSTGPVCVRLPMLPSV